MIFDVVHSPVFYARLGVVKRCRIASELSPDQWPEEVLWSCYSSADKNYRSSIFGKRHVDMWRKKTISLIDALVFTLLSSSNGEAKKAIKNNGIMINRVRCNDISRVLTSEDRLPNLDAIVLENGKYKFGIIEMC